MIDWQAECDLQGLPFRLVFSARGGDPELAGMTATLFLPDRRELHLPVAPGIFRARSVVADRPSLCRDLGAFLVQDQMQASRKSSLLLWLSVDDRPGWDQLSLVLIDLDAGTVLDVRERIGAIKDVDGRQGLTLQVAPERFLVQLERYWLQGTGTDSPENSIEDWHEVRVQADRIQTRWLRCRDTVPGASSSIRLPLPIP
ncbi:MAG: hypothetical protein KDI66_01370 [Xanthomonadales bacterium]|nr:hypothetical protein [Xanthomonadales bacterium]